MMNELDKLSPLWKEALAVHDILGMYLPADKIFVSLSDDTSDFLVVAKDGEKQAAVRIGKMQGCTQEQFMKDWTEVVRAYNASPKSARAELLDRSQSREQAVEIIAGLTLQGFTLRKLS